MDLAFSLSRVGRRCNAGGAAQKLRRGRTNSIAVGCGDLSPEWVTETVVPLVRDGARLAGMSQAAAGYGRRDGDEALRRYLLKVVGA